MKLFIVLLLIFASHLGMSQDDFNTLYSKARAHYKNKEYAEFTEYIQKAYKLHPYHQGVLYYSGISAAINSKSDEAISFLKKTILIESRYDLKNPDLNSLKDRNDFKELFLLQDKMNTPVVNSDTAFVVKDRQLHTEGIAYNSKEKCFYLGSIRKRKIVKVNASGSVVNFVEPKGKEMTSVFGLKVDNKNKFLWACTSPIEQMDGYDTTYRSRVFQYDILNGNVVNSYVPQSEVRNSVFGDLIVNKVNEIYISDSKNNIIFKVNQSTKKLEKYFESQEFANIQGICFSDDNELMFIADYIKGIYQLNTNTRKLSKIACDLDLSLKGIDGLLYYKGSLIAIQNGVFPLRSVRLILSKESLAVINFITIDRAHPSFNEPTLGLLRGSNLYYIANSQWGGYDQTNHIKPFDQLQDIVILHTNLNELK